MSTGDRINEVYYGKLWGADARSAAQERIAWICERVRGSRVLDIGCSQGIVSILLARAGKEVTGVDSNADAIEYARKELAAETEATRERLTFIHGDALQQDFTDDSFDTVVMGQLLEHVLEPEAFLDLARRVCKPDGRVIITTPFGLLVDPDHRHTFYLYRFVTMVLPFVVPEEIDIVGGRICLSGRPGIGSGQDTNGVPAVGEQLHRRIHELSESWFARKENEKHEQLQTHKAELNASWRELSTARTEMSSAGKEIGRLKAELVRERRTLRQIKESLPYQLGNALLRPVRRPGLFALRVAYRVAARSPKWVRGIILKATSKSRMLAAVQSVAETETLSELATRMKGTMLLGIKGYVGEEIMGGIVYIKQQLARVPTRATVPRQKGLRIAVIMDRLSYDGFKHEAELLICTPANWKQVLSETRPDFLLVESACSGDDPSWTLRIGDLKDNPQSQLPALVQWCEDRGIPTAFWNNEDPVRYREFLDAAKLFDYVFTTDADCIEAYKKDLSHDRVFCLPFAVQPRIHNPIGSGRKIRDVAFAGSWYEGETEYRKYRKEQMASIVAPATQFDVDIFDRHLGSKDDTYRFPDEFQPYVVGQLGYDDMVCVYRMYKVFLNVNSVVDSPTVFPRRVLEALASGACVLSGYSRGIDSMIGSQVVRMPCSADETRVSLEELLDKGELRDRLAHVGLRKVMEEHTFETRLDYVRQMMGIAGSGCRAKERGVSIVSCTNKPIYMHNIFANYSRQDYENKELIVVLNSNSLSLAEWEEEAHRYENARVFQVDERRRLGACLNLGAEQARLDYVAKFDDDDYYAPAYLRDMVGAFDYSGADIVGKAAHYVYFEAGEVLAIQFPDSEHRFFSFVAGPTLIIRREVFEKVRFRPDKGPGEDTQFLKDSLSQGLKVYSADRFNFVRVRRAESSLHTWRQSDQEQLTKSRIIAYGEDYEEHVTC